MPRYHGEGEARVVPMSSLNDHLLTVEGLGGGTSPEGDAACEQRGTGDPGVGLEATSLQAGE